MLALYSTPQTAVAAVCQKPVHGAFPQKHRMPFLPVKGGADEVPFRFAQPFEHGGGKEWDVGGREENVMTGGVHTLQTEPCGVKHLCLGVALVAYKLRSASAQGGLQHIGVVAGHNDKLCNAVCAQRIDYMSDHGFPVQHEQGLESPHPRRQSGGDDDRSALL